MDSLQICQWNCRSAIANKSNLECLLAQNNTDIALLSETWFKPGKYVSFFGYNVIRRDRDDGKGGVAILIRQNMKFTEISGPIFNNIYYVCIKIKMNNNSELTLVSLYIKPQSKISVPTWTRFFSFFNGPFLIGGDFNAHHMAWGCSKNDIYGSNLLEAIDSKNIIFLNDGSPPREVKTRQLI